VDNWTDALGSDNSPDEKGNAGRRYEESFDREKMPNLVDWRIDKW